VAVAYPDTQVPESRPDSLGVNAEPITDATQGPALLVQARCFNRVGVGQTLAAHYGSTAMEMRGDGSSVNAELPGQLVGGCTLAERVASLWI
jgi:hypothetical protein